MASVNNSSFPEYILITLGTSFPASGAGFYNLFNNDTLVLKKFSGNAVEVIYTESGLADPSIKINFPNYGSDLPVNRIKLRMTTTIIGYYSFFINQCNGMGTLTPINNWLYINTAVFNAYYAGWGYLTSIPNTLGHHVGSPFPEDTVYDFLEAWNNPYPPIAFKGATLKNLEEYFPDFQIDSTTGGTATASEMAPRTGESITVTAVVNNGYKFMGWSLQDNNTILSTDNPYVFDMPFVSLGTTYRIIANFEPLIAKLINPSTDCIEKGKIISQKVDFSSIKTISKVSIYLDTININRRDYIEEENGIVSFSALNFQSISSEHAWKISFESADIEEYNLDIDKVCDHGFLTNAINTNYQTSDDVFSLSPKISYDIFISEGTYQVWSRTKGFGYFWYSWNNDQSPDKIVVGTDLSWQSIGTIDVSETSIFHLNVYLGSGDIKIDQFYLIKIENDYDLSTLQYALPLTRGPYNTFIKIRNQLTLANIDMVTIGNVGNIGELSGISVPGGSGTDRICGAVDYIFQISKYEITTVQYTEFLNAVAKTDTYGLYNTSMDISVDIKGCNIEQNGVSGNYIYVIGDGSLTDIGNWGNRPINFVSWGDAARFCNWLTNGKPNGNQNINTTEDGSYYLNGATTNIELMSITRKVNAKYVIPTEDEWYKAAYHKNDGVTGNYWDYPTSSDSTPSNVLNAPDHGNNANYFDFFFIVGAPYYRSKVTAFENSNSPYNTFDQGGNVSERNETIVDGNRGARGSSFNDPGVSMKASRRLSAPPAAETDVGGFRIAMVGTEYDAWSWKSSKQIVSNGWYNYDIGVYSGEGLMLDFIVISGSPDFHTQWNYTNQEINGDAYISNDYGKTFSQDQ